MSRRSSFTAVDVTMEAVENKKTPLCQATWSFAPNCLDPVLHQSVVYHPLSWQRTMIPAGHVTSGSVFSLNMTLCGSFPPSAVQANITVKRFFSFPVVFSWMDLAPLVLTVVLYSMANVSDVWSALPICERS